MEPGALRDRFVVEDPDLVYLDGNSLGRLPRAAEQLGQDLVTRQWGDRLIRGWNEGWFELPLRLGDKVARLIGARPGEVVLADSTTVNLHRLASAALADRPGRNVIVTDDLNFPSDHHALGALGAEVRVIESDGVHGPVDGLRAALDESVALLSLSTTAYRSGYTYDMGPLTEAAHDAGALALWDLSHTVGAMPVDLDADGVDLAVGCSYKYLNGGPGAPAWLYVRTEHHARLHNPHAGWMGHADVFSFSPEHVPAEGIRRFLTGTPPVVSMALIEPGLDVLVEAGMPAVREASLVLTDRILERFDRDLVGRGVGLGSPRDPAVRGGHITLTHPAGLAVDLALIDRGVIPDFRPPDGIRLGPAAPYTTIEELDRAMDELVDILDSGAHHAFIEREVTVT